MFSGTEIGIAGFIPICICQRVPRVGRLVDINGCAPAIERGQASAEILILAAVPAPEKHVEPSRPDQKLSLRRKEARVAAQPGMPRIRREFAGPSRLGRQSQGLGIGAGGKVQKPMVTPAERFVLENPGDCFHQTDRRQLVIVESDDMRGLRRPDSHIAAKSGIETANRVARRGKSYRADGEPEPRRCRYCRVVGNERYAIRAAGIAAEAPKQTFNIVNPSDGNDNVDCHRFEIRKRM